jgi:hypothetical protein
MPQNHCARPRARRACCLRMQCNGCGASWNYALSGQCARCTPPEICARLGVTIRTRGQVTALVKDTRGRVAIAEVSEALSRYRIGARRGIVLASGGLSRDPDLRRHYTPNSAGDLTPAVDTRNAPCGARLAASVGATLSAPTKEGAFWVPASTFTRRDGSRRVFTSYGDGPSQARTCCR